MIEPAHPAALAAAVNGCLPDHAERMILTNYRRLVWWLVSTSHPIASFEATQALTQNLLERLDKLFGIAPEAVDVAREQE